MKELAGDRVKGIDPRMQLRNRAGAGATMLLKSEI